MAFQGTGLWTCWHAHIAAFDLRQTLEQVRRNISHVTFLNAHRTRFLKRPETGFQAEKSYKLNQERVRALPDNAVASFTKDASVFITFSALPEAVFR